RLLLIKKLDDILEQLKGGEKIVLSVAAAHDKEVLMAIKDAVERNIITPILVGNEGKIREISKEIGFDLSGIKIVDKDDIKECAEIAVKLVSSKEADFVMKGLLDTSVILKEVLNKDYGLRTDSLLSHVMVYELEKYHKLLITTDG
ncbi:phosphate butyryltransferase, partial [Vibrio parahaemolyticus]|nr:phosphate butyryltransferase [Vibrio parahaemolyticus]